jgi:hypothetical protein
VVAAINGETNKRCTDGNEVTLIIRAFLGRI